MVDSTSWQDLARALRELHRVLMERARRDYEREHGARLGPGELLQLLTSDPQFEWLRSLSELMTDIDILRDAEPQVMDEVSSAVRAAVEQMLSPPSASDAAGAFARRYWPYAQDDPQVAMAHADVRRAVARLPQLQQGDAGSTLHERHLVAEKARHQSQTRRGKR